MIKIDAIAVKQLRDKTGAGIMDCKNALLEAKGDSKLATEILNSKGAVAAKKREDRNPLEGVVGIARDGFEKSAIVEVNVETDSLAQNADFKSLVSKIAKVTLSTDGSLSNVLAEPFDHSGVTVEDKINNFIAITGECIKLRRAAVLCAPGGVISSYVHPSPSDDLGKIGVLVALQSSAKDKKAICSIGDQIALHIALACPSVISVQMLDSAIVAKQRAHYMTQALDAGKSGNIVERIVDGKMNNFFKQIVLTHQDFVVDTSMTVSDFLKASEKSVGASIKVIGMMHFIMGEEAKD
ncbi:translation elongation factor Ts [Candidatus Liberibacter brunswickensis]|uniref:translation elongation factor Ts n=1 Tax=Candidatus Liberibacter brunswickensis TaxID=1968796 RepID=UPI002FDFCA28